MRKLLSPRFWKTLFARRVARALNEFELAGAPVFGF